MWILPASISTAQAINGLCAAFFVVCTLFVATRFTGRIIQRIGLGVDDWCMALGYSSFVGLCICLFIGTSSHAIGYGAKDPMLKKAAVLSGKLEVALDVFATIAFGLVKLSALFFYKRVFCVRGQRSFFRTINDISIVVVILWTSAFFIYTLAVCGTHFNAWWGGSSFRTNCPTARVYLLSASIIDVILEFWIIVLPITKVMALQTTLRRRLGVLVVFLVALLSLATSAARLAIVCLLAVPGAFSDTYLANSAIYFMWVLEAGSAIVAVNMPSLWFLRKYAAPESILRSIRSIISLRSVTSVDSKGSHKDLTRYDSTKPVQTDITAVTRSSAERESEGYDTHVMNKDIVVASHVSRVSNTV